MSLIKNLIKLAQEFERKTNALLSFGSKSLSSLEDKDFVDFLTQVGFSRVETTNKIRNSICEAIFTNKNGVKCYVFIEFGSPKGKCTVLSPRGEGKVSDEFNEPVNLADSLDSLIPVFKIILKKSDQIQKDGLSNL